LIESKQVRTASAPQRAVLGSRCQLDAHLRIDSSKRLPRYPVKVPDLGMCKVELRPQLPARQPYGDEPRPTVDGFRHGQPGRRLAVIKLHPGTMPTEAHQVTPRDNHVARSEPSANECNGRTARLIQHALEQDFSRLS